MLWKASKPEEPSWEVGVGPGRPGWHLECSAMALRLLGESPIDIHAGGIDLIFPHHENEIAQSEGATGKPFARFWIHVAHLFVENEKMSKSLGNVYTLPEVVERGYRPSALRYLLLSSHYRKPLNFTWAGMDQAEESLRRIVDCLARLDTVTADGRHAPVQDAIAAARTAFTNGLLDDLNTAAGLAAIFDLVRELNAAIDAKAICRQEADEARRVIDECDRVLGVVTLRRAEDARPPVPVEEIEQLIADRKAARARRDFAAADAIRVSLAGRGILLGGDDGTQAGSDPRTHRGFPNTSLALTTAHNAWTNSSSFPPAVVTTPTVTIDDFWVIPSGEIRPGIRSPKVWLMAPEKH